MRHTSFLTTWALVSLLALASGCQEKAAPPPPAPAAKKVAPAPKPSQAGPEAIQAPPKYVYDPLGKRDPFESPLDQIQKPDGEEVPLTPLQKFDLGQFRLIGIIIGKGEPTAMVLAPDKKSFILKKGIKIGKNDGTILRITPNSVVVEEKIYDFSGEAKSNIQEIQLPKRGGVE